MAGEFGEQPIPAFRVIDGEGNLSGEVEEVIQRLQDELSGAERDVKKWRVMCANLERDADAEAEEDPLWPAAKRVFAHWQEVCGHKKAIWTRERFEEARPYLKKYGEPICMKAVDGIAFDPFITDRKNGTKRRHDGWHLIFGKAEQFEERVKAAPRAAPEASAEPVPDLRLV